MPNAARKPTEPPEEQTTLDDDPVWAAHANAPMGPPDTEEVRKLIEEARKGPFIPGEVMSAMVEARVRHEHDYTEEESTEIDKLFERAELEHRARGAYPVEAVIREIEAITERGARERRRRAEGAERGSVLSMSTAAKNPVEIAEEPGDEGQRILDEADEEDLLELESMLQESLEEARDGKFVSNEDVFQRMARAP